MDGSGFDNLSLMFFHPGKVDSLAMFFQNPEEKETFLSGLDEKTREYVMSHSQEFHSRDELEVVAARLRKDSEI